MSVEKNPLDLDFEGFRKLKFNQVDLLDLELLEEYTGDTLEISLGVRLAIDCRHCKSSLPINALTARIICTACGNKIELDKDWWSGILNTNTLASAYWQVPRSGVEVINANKGLHLQVRRIQATCKKCGEPFSSPDTTSQESGVSMVACKSCKTQTSIREPDEFEPGYLPELIRIIGEGVRAEGGATIIQGKKNAVVISCMKCGAALDVDGSTRLVPCNYCETSNYLPDDLWFHLHPRPIVSEFFLNLKLSGVTRMDWLVLNLDRCEILVRNRTRLAPVVEDALLERLIDLIQKSPRDVLKINGRTTARQDPLEMLSLLIQKHAPSEAQLRRVLKVKKEEVWLAVAKLNKLPESIFNTLSKSKDYSIRCHVARNPNCPQGILKHLATDTDSDVREAVRKNKNASIEVLARIVHSSDYEDRAWVARRKEVADFPDAELQKLLLDDDSDVQSALKNNKHFPFYKFADQILAAYENSTDLKIYFGNLTSDLFRMKLENQFRFLKGEKSNISLVKIAGLETSTTEMLEFLSTHKSNKVREKVAGNTNTSAEAIKRLSLDAKKNVSVAAKAHAKYIKPGLFESMKIKLSS